MAENKQNQEEEIDLGSLFKAIENGIRNLFKSIGNFFLKLFHFFILLLIFLKKHTIKLGLAIVIGAVVGYFLDSKKLEEYRSELIIETNFGSGFQLYKQIGYLNNLVSKKDTISLAKSLKISIQEASQLTSFEVAAYQPKINLYKLYDKYIQTTDTIYTREFNVENFKKRLNEYDYRYHEVKVKSNTKSIFRKISAGIKGLVENEYFKNSRNIKKNEIEQRLIILHKNLVQIDSLRALYKNVALIKAEKQVSTSTIEISQKQFDNNKNDVELFHTSNQILDRIEGLNNEKLRNENILNFMSDFEELGVLDKKITEKKYFQMAVLFGGLMLLTILLLQFNIYLNNYKK